MNAVSIEQHTVNMSRLHCFHTYCKHTQIHRRVNTLKHSPGAHTMHTHTTPITFIITVVMQAVKHNALPDHTVISFGFLIRQGHVDDNFVL